MKASVNKHRQFLVFDTQEEMSDFMVERWRELAREAIEKKGYFAAALSGGETPVPFYRKLSALKNTFPWDRTHIFLADERLVPSTHYDSNYGMLLETFLRTSGIPAGNCHSVPVEGTSPENSAKRYEEELVKFFRLSEGRVPEFDLVILGIGEDGHTASLFPGSPAVTAKEGLTIAVILDETRHDRITLALPVINNAKKVIFLVSGRKKAEMLKRVIEGDRALPASLVSPEKGDLLFAADREAAILFPIGSGET